jgi:hypothetical protein
MKDEAQNEKKELTAVEKQRGVIKHCPLCKEKEELTPMDANGGDRWAIICWQCDYQGPEGDTPDEAVYLHNKAVL